MRTLFLTLCKLRMYCLCAYHQWQSKRPERQVGNGEQQPCRLVKYYCHYDYGIIVFVSGNICTCVHRTTFYKIISITIIKHATDSCRVHTRPRQDVNRKKFAHIDVYDTCDLCLWRAGVDGIANLISQRLAIF